MSLQIIQRDVAIWTDQGWLERHSTGTYIYWRLLGQGPLKNHAPDRSKHVARILTALKERGALTTGDAAELNQLSPRRRPPRRSSAERNAATYPYDGDNRPPGYRRACHHAKPPSAPCSQALDIS